MHVLCMSFHSGMDTFSCEADISDSVCSGATFYVPRQNADRGTIFVQNQPSSESQFMGSFTACAS